VPAPDERRGLLPEASDDICGSGRDVGRVSSIPLRNEQVDLVADHSLGVEFPLEGVELLVGGRAPCDPKLSIDREEGDDEDEPAQRRPEPLRARPDERYAVRVDELHDRILRPAATMGGTIRAGSNDILPFGRRRGGREPVQWKGLSSELKPGSYTRTGCQACGCYPAPLDRGYPASIRFCSRILPRAVA